MWQIILSLLICSVRADPVKAPNQSLDWRIYFYTGGKVWAGTDSRVYVELLGKDGNSPILNIKSNRYQMEANSIDSYSLGDLSGRKLGDLVSIVVGKQHSYSFFNDWLLEKAEVVDPSGKRYIFVCNCWLTTFRAQRLINLTRVEYLRNEFDDDLDNRIYSARNAAAFPATIGILFILLILIIFTYFGNEICKKWRENIIYLTHSSRNRPQEELGAVTLSPRQERNRNVYRNVDEPSATNIPLNTAIHYNSTIEDKPPDYKELFPGQTQPSQQNENTEASQKNTTL
ncbi:unnamed protein product [Brachionus calyciflorus]|uniref:PLAT domain-containing protein n=1 Tax=Brachionus calyciflorus TaxID=104777 RepID=A0A814ACW7_9BILA|nr:unnamed protein product [Brachionus calyciflorus]